MPSRDTAHEPVDVVYTWVDDAWPGYLDTLNRYAKTKHDTNRNRTRDNIDVLRYSMRSLSRYVPWVRNVYLLTMRPQVPSWLDVENPRVHVVHHDEVMESRNLPTFNSFAITSYMHALEGLSERFLYLADDYLMGAAVERSDLIGEGDIDPVYLERRYAPRPALMDSQRISPWDSARAFTSEVMNQAFGSARRRDPGHLACGLRRSAWGEMIERWPEEFARTRASRFRARYNIAPEFLYAHFLLHTGRGAAVSDADYRRRVHYVGINNMDLKARYDTWRLRRMSPRFYALNDDFGVAANPRVVERWRRCLDAMLPDPSPFERRGHLRQGPDPPGPGRTKITD